MCTFAAVYGIITVRCEKMRMLNTYLRERFGTKVYKLSLCGCTTCPNRDGTVGTRGCIFCSETGSGEFAQRLQGSVSRQIESAKKRVEKKAGKNCRYIAYFQSFTNTYAPISYLKKIFTEAISHPEVCALSIATRPDCLPLPVMELLSELNKIKPVWVELGLQTVNEATAKYIRRGYDLSVFDEAMEKLKAAGLEVIVHMIIGLPGETVQDMKQTAKYISDVGADGIKLQLLHVLKNTDLEKEYEAGAFQVLEQDEYINILAECLKELRSDIVVHRLTGDGAKAALIAPLWSGDKKKVLAQINRMLAKEDF